jgi:murein DD-endopeptidase MepM/ murein hydrolase activator NlpD
MRIAGRRVAVILIAVVLVAVVLVAAVPVTGQFGAGTASADPLPTAVLPTAVLPTAVLPTAVLPTAVLPTAPAPATRGAPVYRPPLAGVLRIVRGFQAPASAYSAGHRGVDLAAEAGAAVLAAGSGTVRFAGPVAGRGVIVVAHPSGVTTEYEPATPNVRMGAIVAAGERIGTLGGTSCPGAICLHWGAKRDGAYFDPLLLLRRLGPVRLLPDHARG